MTINVSDIKEWQIILFGMGKTGQSTLTHLAPLVKQVIVYEDNPSPLSEDLIALCDRYNVQFYSETLLSDEVLSSSDILIKSPGINYTHPLIVKAEQQQLPIITDIELASQLTQAELIAITGSNGKTTTTSLVDQIFKIGYKDGVTHLGGNIGIPVFDHALDATASDEFVWEVSSFQLQGTREFHPHIAAFVNLSPTHLDYHGSIAGYLEAKWQITANQTADDYLVLNADQTELWEKRTETKAQIIPVSIEHPEYDGAWYDRANEQLMWRDESVISRQQLQLPGDHNVQNALNAIAIAKCANIDNDAIRQVLETFSGVKHRIQFVTTINGRRFYNDSKATNDEATLTALHSFDTPLIWIAGGLERHLPIDDLLPALNHVKTVVTTGETNEKFAKLAEQAGIPVVEYGEWIEDTVAIAYENSEPGDTILLSPASASWDQYPNFEVRGDRFIQAVEKLANEKGNNTCD